MIITYFKKVAKLKVHCTTNFSSLLNYTCVKDHNTSISFGSVTIHKNGCFKIENWSR